VLTSILAGGAVALAALCTPSVQEELPTVAYTMPPPAQHDDFLEDLAAARDAGKTIYEDYTWKGMPDAYADDDLRADAIQGEQVGIADQLAALHQGCWFEYKEDQPTELLYGDLALMPADATEVPCDQVDEALEYPMDDVAAERPVEYYGGTPGGAVCSTDAACSAYTRDKGGEYGYGASPEKAVLWDGIPA
jgi:hypothetical protein